jgi:hypothetical protein
MRILRRLPISATRRICSIIFFVCNTTTLVADVNFNVAWGPQPANNATNVRYKTPDGNSITLGWQKGDLAKQHDVYFGTSFADVNSATTASAEYKGSRYDANGDPCNWTIADFNFKVNTSYYWRIDETNDSNVLAQGFVWKFTTHNGRAYNPKPTNGGTGLSEPLALTWTAGDFAASTNGHRVFFGTSYNDVNDANTTTDKVYRGTVTNPSYPIANLYPDYTLAQNTTYYWKVTEVNGSTTWPGPVWSVTTTEYITIDDFEGYNNSDELRANWQTAYDTNCGSTVGNGGLSLVWDATGKHMKFTYINDGSREWLFSEAKRPYSGGTSFTGGGVISPALKALRVDYRGAATNAVDPVYDRMYVAIEDTMGNVAVYQNPDGNAALAGNWTSWYSNLYDINAVGNTNLQDINGFAIGFGLRCNIDELGGGDGNVMFDNIRLYTICGGNSSADFDRNNIVDWWDFDWIPEFWLVDYSSGYAPITAPIVDLYPDCVIDFKDFAVFANQWLTDGQ